MPVQILVDSVERGVLRGRPALDCFDQGGISGEGRSGGGKRESNNGARENWERGPGTCGASRGATRSELFSFVTGSNVPRAEIHLGSSLKMSPSSSASVWSFNFCAGEGCLSGGEVRCWRTKSASPAARALFKNASFTS